MPFRGHVSVVLTAGRVALASALLALPGLPAPAEPSAAPHQAARVPEVPRVVSESEQAEIRRWRDHILPTSDERAWERIPWLPSFSAGIVAAQEQGKPLLLWVMNGHPLGCT